MVKIKHEDIAGGVFCGIRKHGGYIYAPPMGTGTYTQGIVSFGTISKEERVQMYRELAEWVFANGLARAIKVDDWALRQDWTDKEWVAEETYHDPLLEGIEHLGRPVYTIDLTAEEDKLWSRLHYKSCKYCINKARKCGLTIHQITERDEIAEFVRIHVKQIEDVSHRHGEKGARYQNYKELYSLCSTLFPNNILMLQVVGKDENGETQIMSSGIWIVGNSQSIWFTASSYQRYQKYCPNELMNWEAMRLLHRMGCVRANTGGVASYKGKYGSTLEYIPRIIFRKTPHTLLPDEVVKKLYVQLRYFKRKIKAI
ncbi:MAG: GNAT family N-acetyltransferase [Paludibacteraceae bacterium]